MSTRSTAGAKLSSEIFLAGTIAVLGCGFALYRSWYGQSTMLGLELSAQVVAAAATLWRIRWPGAVAVVVIALSFLSPAVANVTAQHAVGRFMPNRWLSSLIVAGAAAAAVPVWWTSFDRRTPLVFTQMLLAVLVPWLIGRATRSRIDIEHAKKEAAMAEVERATRDRERSRLVREMHDVVAHRISLVVLETQILRTKTRDPQLLEGLEHVSTRAREALDEMRRVLQLTSRDEPSRGLDRFDLASIEDVARDARAVGQPVEVDICASPSAPGPDVSERTAARIVREALTNALRHAPGAMTRVRVQQDGQELLVEVINESTEHPPTGLTTGGFGLKGMHERVAMIGGTFSAHPTDTGGFAVHARLPRPLGGTDERPNHSPDS